MAGAVLAVVPALLPYAGAIVTACEHLFSHQPGSGPQKKQAAMAMMRAGLGVLTQTEATPGTPVAGSQLETHLSTLIDDTVAVMNDVAAFCRRPQVVK